MRTKRGPVSPKAAKEAAFKHYWMKWGMHLFNKAEAHGVNFLDYKAEQFSAAVILAEEWATPDEYKTRGKFEDLFPTTSQRR
jgi:hypothetical protein